MTKRQFLSLLLAVFMVFSTITPLFAEGDSVTVLPPRMAEETEEPDNIVIMEDNKNIIPIIGESEEGGKKIEETKEISEESDEKEDNSPKILENREEGDNNNIVILPPIRNKEGEEVVEEEKTETYKEVEEPKQSKKEVKVQILSKRDAKKPASSGEVNLVLLNDNPADVNEEIYDEKIRWKESDFKIEEDKIISLSDEGLLKAKINKKLVIPEMENITIIEKEAFKGLSLRSVEIPKNIQEIKDEAFKDNHLKLVKILGKGKEISKNAFNKELVEEYGKCEDEEFLYEYESTDEDELEIGEEIIGDAVGEGNTNVYVKDQYGNPIPKYRITTGRVIFRVECSSANPNECRGYSVVNHIDTQKDFFTDSNGYVSVTTPYLNGNPVPPPALDGIRDYFSKEDEGRTFSNIFIDGYRAEGVLFIENHDSPREPYNIERRYFPYVVYEYSPINLNLLYKAPWDDMKFFAYDGTKITGLSNAGIEYYSKNPHMRIPGINPEGDNITEIADKAFKKSSLPAEINLTEVSFYGANNIEKIGYESFEGHKINEIYNPPNNLVSISPSAFLNNELEEINLWGLSNLQSIGTNAFGNNKLKIAKIPLSVKPILGFSPFTNNPGSNSDKQVYVFTPDKTNPNNIKDNQFHLINPVTTPDDVRAYTFSGTTITGLSEKGEKFYKDNHNMVLPGKNPQGQAITAIGESAFYNDGNGYGLTSVDFKNLASLKSIGESAFGRNQLTNINLSKCTSLISINGHAFMFNKLTSIDFSKCVNLKNIDDSAFYNNRLTNLDLSGCTNLTNIAGYAFNGNQLANLSLSGCTNLVSVGSSAFAKNKLTGLDLSECKNLTSIGNNAFGTNQLTDLDLSGCTSLKDIRARAFSSNQLKTAKIPLSLTNLADDAFKYNIGNNDKKQVYLYTSDKTNPNNLQDTEYHLINPITGPDDVSLYTFNGTTITGLSDKGRKYYAQNHDMILPCKNPEGEYILSIKETAFSASNMYSSEGSDATKISLNSVDFSKMIKLESIEEGAFYETPINKVIFGNTPNLKTIGQQAFIKTQIQKLDLSGASSLEKIGAFAFGFNNLNNLELSNLLKLSIIDANAFAGGNITDLKLYNLPNLKVLKGFAGNSLTSLDLSNMTQLEEIGAFSFAENKISELDLSKLTNLKILSESSFIQNNIKTAKIPLSLKTIANNAFQNNLGNNDKKQVYLYTPDYTNPNNLKDTDYHLINPITDSDDSTLYTFEGTVITGLSERGKKYFETHHEMKLPKSNSTGSNITAIGEEAFYNSGNGYGITNVDFSNCSSLKNIGNYAFYNNNIQNLDLSNNLELTTIGEAAFRKNQLTSLDLSKNTIIKNINLGAFSDNKINSINLSNCTNLDSIAPFAFKNNNIEELDLSTCSALTNIGSQAFADNNIKTSDIPLNVKKIGFTAFKNNPGNNEEKQVYLYTYNHANPNNLKDTDYHLINPIAGPDDVSLYEFSPDGEGLLGLTPKGIEYYKNHTHMVLPGISPEGVSVKYIDENAFSKEENIERLYYDDACVIKTLDLTNMKELTHIGGGVFFQNGIESIDFTGLTKLKIIDNEAFMRNNVTELDLSSLESLEELGHFVFGQNKLKTLNLNGLKNLKAIYDLAFGINKIEKLDLSSCTSLKKIDLQAFFNNKLNTVNIPLSVEEIGVDAFQFNPGNNTKQQVYLYTPDRTNPHNIKDTNTYLINPETRPDDFNLYTFEGTTITGLTERGKKYFKENPNIKLPGKNPQGESITAIADNAFSPEEYDENYPVFESVDFSNCSSLLAIGNGAFAGHYFDKLDLSPCTSLIAIGDSAFAFNEGSHGTEDKDIEVSFMGLKNLKTIGESAFAGPDIGNRVGKIDFSGCTGLEIIGEGAFFWSRIDNLDLSSCTNLKTIKKMAFMSTDLKTLNLSGCKNLTTIEETAFHGNKLNSIDFSGCSNLQTIGSYAFAFSSLKTLDLSKCTSLKVIEKGAFYNGKINIAYIPLSLSTLADDAFQDNPGNNDKKQVYLYTPDYTNPNNLKDTNYHLINPITGSDDVTLYTFDKTTITGLSERGKEYFKTHHDMKLPGKNPQGEPITAIGKFGFTSRSTHVGFGLVSVDFSNCTSLTSIGYSAFGYNNLTSIDLSGCTNLKSIDDFAFERNQITSLDLSECTNLTNIGVSAFCENQITSLNVSGCTNLTSIGEATFAGNKLTSLDLSGCTNLRSIGKAAFQQNQIANLNLSGCTNLTNIANHAFYENQLTSLDLSECTSLKSIGIAAFYKNQLASLDLSTCTNLTSIGHHAFTYNKLTSLDLSGCISLKSIDKVAFAANKLKTSKIPLSLTTLADSTFQDNPGNNDKKQVYLYTPTRNNPMNLRDSEYHLVDPISFTIKKVDTKGNPMEGVEFAFYKLDRPTPPQNWTFPNPSTVVGVKLIFLTVTTDKNGKAEVTLPYSPYFLAENKTIPGYSINNTVTPIDATTEGKIITYTDYEVSIEIPETGTLGIIPYILLALILVGGAYVVLRKKKEEEK